MIDGLFADLRYAARRLRQAPLPTLLAVGTLGLGIGATTTIFSLVDALTLRQLSLPDQHRLVGIRQRSPTQCPDCDMIAAGNVASIREVSRTLTVVAATKWSPTLRAGDRSDIVRGYRVTPDFLDVLEVPTAIGRTFGAENEVVHSARSVVLGPELWRSRFGADPNILGTTLILDGVPHTVVGVIRDRHVFPPGTQVWVPLALTQDEQAERSSTDYEAFARIRPGWNLAQARAELATLATRLATAYPETMEGWNLEAFPIREWRGEARTPLLLMLSAAGFVLLIACANLAGLLLAQAVVRRGEIGIRTALGASRHRVIRQLLTESVLLAVVGAGIGLLFSLWAVSSMKAALPEYITRALPGWTNIRVSGRVLGVGMATAVATGILFGLAPALRLSRPQWRSLIGDTAVRTIAAGRQSLRRTLIISQLALTIVLTTGAALIARGVVGMYARDPGIRTDRVLTMRLRLPPGPHDRRVGEIYDELIARIEGLHGVDAAAVANTLPLTQAFSSAPFRIDGVPESNQRAASAGMRVVTANYFAVLRIPLVLGRLFTPNDRVDAPRVAIINETLAQRFFADRNPLGARVIIGDEPYEIVGVVGDVLHRGLHRAAEPEIYCTQAQVPWTSVDLAVATHVEPAELSNGVRTTIAALDPDVAVAGVRSMTEIAAEALSPFRMLAVSFGVLAALALVLSTAGLYGIISYHVAQRRREYGVRMAIGAEPRQIVLLVLVQSIRMLAVGATIGLAGAVAVGRVLGAVLYGVAPNDPTAFIGAILLLGAVILLASYTPARRAARVTPAEWLRNE